MVKSILGETFEQLEQIPKQVVKQMAKLPVDVTVGAVKSVVGQRSDFGSQPQPKIDPLTGIEIPSSKQIQKLQKKEKKLKAAAIPHAQQIITGIKKPSPQVPAYVAGKPGFSEEKIVKTHELGEKKKKELPPPVSAAKPKWGTAERKLGVSG